MEFKFMVDLAKKIGIENVINFTKYLIKKTKDFLAKKPTIELDKNNKIINKNIFDNTIKTMINYRLYNKHFILKIDSKKWQDEYTQVKEKKDLQLINQFKDFLLKNEQYTDFCTDVITLIVKDVTTKKLLNLDYIPNIAEGIINHMRYESYKNHMKLDLFTPTNDFGCSIYINEQEVEALQKNIPFAIEHLTSNSGYDICNLPRNMQYEKAIPAIICKLYERDNNLNNLEKYLFLKIGIG